MWTLTVPHEPKLHLFFIPVGRWCSSAAIWVLISLSSCSWIYPRLFVVQLLRRVQLFATPWTAACQASLSFTISWSLLKLMSFELVMPSNHLILCCPFSWLQSFPTSGSFPMRQLFTSGGQSIFRFSTSPFNEYPRASLGAQTVKHLSAMQETRVWSLVWEDPLEKEMAAESSILAWKNPMDGGAW